MLKNLASALFLSERDAELDNNAPEVKGRIITTIHKAKEVRPLVEKCITIARKSLPGEIAAREFATTAKRGTEPWKVWRNSEDWQKWCAARGPVVTARRRALQLLGNKQAVEVLFSTVAPKFEDRPGGYTRILRLAKPRVGDAGTRAALEFVGKHDRVRTRSQKPRFDAPEDSGPTGSEASAAPSRPAESPENQ